MGKKSGNRTTRPGSPSPSALSGQLDGNRRTIELSTAVCEGKAPKGGFRKFIQYPRTTDILI